MRRALYIGFVVLVLGGLSASCQLGERVEKGNTPPHTFIEEGFPNEGQTWLSNSVSFRFFGADLDNEIVAFQTRLEPALIETTGTGVIDTLWMGDPGYFDPTPDTILSFFDWDLTLNQNMSYQGVADALYRFSVRAIDEASELDPTPALRHFLVLAATWPDIVIDRCPPSRDAAPREDFRFHGELGSLEPHEFEYSWMMVAPQGDPMSRPWTEWTPAVNEVSVSGFQLGREYTFRVRCRVERADTYIESRGFAECPFRVRSQ